MQNGYEFNSLEFITAGGPVAITVALILLVMSVASWYLIVTKAVQAKRVHRAFKAYAQAFWGAPNINAAIKQSGQNALANLARHGLAAAEHHKAYAVKNNDVSGQADRISKDEIVARALNRSIADESLRIEKGLSVLASVGSVSPFVGLFGTVWGIYHALASISLSGQATLDKVAGPVGEALIMTALGLAVAIPAVLAYNALVRSNRLLTAELEEFGYELHTFLITGAVIQAGEEVVKQTAEYKERIHIVGAAA